MAEPCCHFGLENPHISLAHTTVLPLFSITIAIISSTTSLTITIPIIMITITIVVIVEA